MKKAFSFVFIFISIITTAQNKNYADTSVRPAITAFGKPDGEKSEIKIGKEGGSFTSFDGKIRLIIPEDAVSKKTIFSIQPSTNLMPNGNGKTYKMEPSGINFKKPLQIVFYFTDNELESNSPDLLAIAMQDDKGQWSALNKMILDTTSKTLTAYIHHFSSYVNYRWSKIDPATARVKVNGSLRLTIRTLVPLDEDEDGDDELSPLGGVETQNVELWSVNSMPKGNGAVGLISTSQNLSAIYQAPANIPQQNPVTVSVEPIYEAKYLNRYNHIKLISNITIYDDAYEVKMEASIIGGSPAAWGGIVTYRDEGSFIVSLEKNKPAVINIKNQMEVMTDNCQKIIINPNSNTGLFHVAGTRQIKITPASPPGQPNAIVEIFFIPHPIELTHFKFICPPPPGVKQSVAGKIDLSQMVMMMFMGKPAIPQYLKFIANDEEQILLESPKGVPEIYYKVWVKKVKEE